MTSRYAQAFATLLRREPRLRTHRGTPKVVALTATRDEDWILGLSLRVSLSYCDAVVISDHDSSDGTDRIIEEVRAEFPDRQISVHRTHATEWMEVDVRQEMLDRGRRLGATHFVIADADEVPTGNLFGRLRELALKADPGRFTTLPMISTYHDAGVYRWDGPWGENSAIAWAFCDCAQLRWKSVDGYQLHRRTPHPAVNAGPAVDGREPGGLFHLQFVNKTRLQSKAVWYKMIETLRYPGKRSPGDLNQVYDWTLREGPQMRLHPVPNSWWEPYRTKGWLRHFTPEATSWQQHEIGKLVAEHGLERFAGLDLHGRA